MWFIFTALSLQFVSGFVRFSTVKHTNRLSNTIVNVGTEIDTEIETELTASSIVQPKLFNWEKQWYPIAVEELTDKNKTQPMMLLGNDIVLWHDGSAWRVFEDSCPHRGVPLSEGRVEKNGELLCAYHAWTFDGEGQCTSIPQTPTTTKEDALKASAASCVKSYPTQVRQGLIWAWGEKGAPGSDVSIQAALKQPRLIEELEDPVYTGRITPFKYNFRDLPYGWDMFMENVLDPAHVVVSHHGIVGNRYTDTAAMKLIRMSSSSEVPVSQGGEMIDAYPEDAGFKYRVQSLSPKASNLSVSTDDFRPPCLNKITTENADGSKFILALYATPTKPGYCRHIGTQLLIKDSKGKTPPGLGMYALPLPLWFLHVAASFFLHQDQVFLHNQERMLYASSNYAFGNFSSKISTTSNPQAYSSTYFMPNEHDKMISHLRQWIFKKAGGGVKWGRAAVQQGLPSRLPSAELFDVYHSHTKNCVVCQDALKNVRLVRQVSLGLAVLGLALAKRVSVKLAVGAVFSLLSLAAHKLSKLFFKYEYSHQSNN